MFRIKVPNKDAVIEITKKDIGDAAAIGTGVAASIATAGTGTAIASLGSIGIAALGGAISKPLFPIIGTAVIVAGVPAAIIAGCAAGDAVEDHMDNVS